MMEVKIAKNYHLFIKLEVKKSKLITLRDQKKIQ